jgi:cold shock protein
MKTGIVKWYSSEKRYGFITEDNSDAEYFVHVSGLEEAINQGNAVEFDTKMGYNGREQAINVRRI